MKLKAAIIGCGAIGVGGPARAHPDVGAYTHADAYSACPDAELVAVVDRDLTRAQAAARRFDVEAYANVPELLESRPPGVGEPLHAGPHAL